MISHAHIWQVEQSETEWAVPINVTLAVCCYSSSCKYEKNLSQESIAFDATTPCPGTHHPGKKVLISYNLDKMLGAFVFFGTGMHGNKTFWPDRTALLSTCIAIEWTADIEIEKWDDTLRRTSDVVMIETCQLCISGSLKHSQGSATGHILF